jgi:DnaK suppressor protein
MPELNVSECQRLLERKREDLLSSSLTKEDIAIEAAADEMDRLQQQMSREIAIRRLDHTSTLLKSVRIALDRIEDEVYGVCLRCEEPISEKRLKAIPWASHCVACQEIIDRDDASSAEDDSTIGFAA